MTVETKIARQRLSVLQLAERLGNIAEARRRRGIDIVIAERDAEVEPDRMLDDF